ncbi:multiple inositol polyphosphate phosphatase 1a [Danio rerio]|uniref:Multiple inositol polyphosphate phosphatase 1 n=1 Tax=Danio rerio TaxID=7955 RepID=Q08CJ4_DANRE|nr:multiple inositol polyphosphate phosphatase 1a [Danio rerio]AAI24217.1 Zgc:153026 [Danio rerio]AAI64680.1 Zgc:153026 protein [Danio rerio]|eukprot:NP_001071025.1 multiple inositol-polyphosphate phosphatase 1a [Danio rerio]
MAKQVVTTVCFVLFHLVISYWAFMSSCSLHSSTKPSIPTIARYFGTKGRYEDVNSWLIDDILAINKSLVTLPSSKCSEIHLTAIIRHGTRFPTTKNIQKMREFYDLVKLNATGDLTSLSEIKSQWKMWYSDEMDGRLVEKGREDHKHLAQRLIKWFPSLLNGENVHGKRVKLITSSKHRCVNSTIAFREGLMTGLKITAVELEPELNDALMRYFDQCERFVKEVENNKSALEEVKRFNEGPEMKRVMEKMADRLDVPYSSINDDSVEAAFYLCAYEFAILSVNSPWCQLFDEVDAQVMEYSNDLKQYWKRSYGHVINSKSSCILFHDLFHRLDQIVDQINSDVPVTEAVTVQVGHAETLIPLLTLLDLFKDDVPLNSTNFNTQQNRVFRSGRITPYAANLLVVLYRCPEGIRIGVRLNEKSLTLPGLSEPVPMYEDVKERYSSLLGGCDQETVCKMNSS